MQLLSSFYFCFCLIYILVFVEESVGKGFIDGCGFVHDSSRGILRRITGKIFLTFQSFSLRFPPPAATNWNTAAIKILLLFEAAILFIWFGLTKASPATGSERKWKLNMHIFTAEYRKSFFTCLNRFQELHTRWAWVIITVFVSF